MYKVYIDGILKGRAEGTAKTLLGGREAIKNVIEQLKLSKEKDERESLKNNC